MKNRILHIVLLALLIVLENGCYSSYSTTKKSELDDMRGEKKLRILTVDSSLYAFHTFSTTDSTISGQGLIVKGEQKREIDTVLKFSDIVHIERLEVNTWKTILLIGGVSAIAIGASLTNAGNTGFSITEHLSQGWSGNSCPFIYASDGKNFILEGEAFGISLGKALESETCIILPNAKPKDGRIFLNITNERPETHFFNSITMFAVETNPDETVYADNHENFLAVKSKKKIDKAEENGREITQLLAENDDKFWESDLSTATTAGGFEDKIIVNCTGISANDSLTLLVSAKNTNISTSVFDYLQKILGDEFANFTRAAEVDTELTGILRETLVRSALKVDVWNGSEWVYADMILPEANQVKFQKALRVALPKFAETFNGKLKIRLRCMTDLWRIDALHFDDAAPVAVKIMRPELLRYASTSLNGQDSSIILKKDNTYMTLIPGQNIEAEYQALEPSKGKKITYSAKISGYLYELIIDSSMIPGDLIRNLPTNTLKLQMTKKMLSNFDVVLPVIYENWRKAKEMHISSK